MKANTVYITLEEAKGYYNSGNDTLKSIALRAFHEDELKTTTYENILYENFIGNRVYYIGTNAGSEVESNIGSFISVTPDPEEYYETTDIKILQYMAAMVKLRNIAIFFNKTEKIHKGYTIECDLNNPNKLTVTYPGRNYINTPVVFKNNTDAEHALNMLTEEEKSWIINLNQ